MVTSIELNPLLQAHAATLTIAQAFNLAFESWLGRRRNQKRSKNTEESKHKNEHDEKGFGIHQYHPFSSSQNGDTDPNINQSDKEREMFLIDLSDLQTIEEEEEPCIDFTVTHSVDTGEVQEEEIDEERDLSFTE